MNEQQELRLNRNVPSYEEILQEAGIEKIPMPTSSDQIVQIEHRVGKCEKDIHILEAHVSELEAHEPRVMGE